MTSIRRASASLLLLLMLLHLFINALPIAAAAETVVDAQSTAQEQAQAMLEAMTVEEKIGQLFLLGFNGTSISQNSQIYSLINDYHIGGVILSTANDNFQPGTDPLETYAALINGLQAIEYKNSNQYTEEGGASASQYIPLYVGIEQPGDGAPGDQILSGLTTLPSQMAVGATWNTDAAYQVGLTQGSELSALGFNLYIGPSLDVVEEGGGWLGVNSFGSDPTWVGSMGQAYIRGLHEGAQNEMLVIARHFPGSGGIDRASTTEVATVLKTLQQLEAVDLAPFFAVTGLAPDSASQADGLLLPHTRYQALQGTIRSTTRPVTLDGNAMQQLFNHAALGSWEASGGLVISDNLDSMALRKFFDPLNFTFDARQVTTAALSAGNDILYIDGLVSSSEEENFLLLIDALNYFAQKYREDTIFAGHVDASVLKILTSKYLLYGEFSPEAVTPEDSRLANVGGAAAMVFNVAQSGATLLSPDADDLDNVLTDAPQTRERILFLSDTLSARQCSKCDPETEFSERALMDAVLRLYGPQGSGQVVSNRLSAYPLSALKAYLDDINQLEEHPVLEELTLADWVVISILDYDTARSSSLALKQLLAEKPDLLRFKKVVVFAFNTPTTLDATEIANLSAYYALYSKADAFVDVAARLLFKDMPASGSLPISVSAIGYDIELATSPDPAQLIPLVLDLETLAAMLSEQQEALQPTAVEGAEEPLITPSPTLPPSPAFQVNDLIPLLAGPIYDRNGRVVPDGTAVQFQAVLYSDNPGLTQIINTETVSGMARAVFPIQRSGLMEIRVVSETAGLSSVLQIDVPDEGNASIMEVSPMPVEERTPQVVFPTFTPEPTQTQTPTPTLTPVPAPVAPSPQAEEWILGMALAWMFGFAAFALVYRSHNLRWQSRRGLIVVISSILGYSYLAINLPGSTALYNAVGGAWSTLIVSTIGAVLGYAIGWLWHHELE